MTEKQPINFIKEVAKYFMDFLESDFHKRNAPKRSIALKNEKNYLVGINLKKYEKFSNIVQKLILKKFDKEVFSHIEKGIYYTNIPKDFIDLIDLKVSKISEKEIKLLQERIVDALLTNAQIHKTELNLAISESLDLIAKAYNELILYGFFEDLKQPIESLKFGDINTVSIMQEELNGILIDELSEKVKEILKNLLVDEKVDIDGEIKASLTLENLQGTLRLFFENFKLLDLYEEIDELLRNKMIMDKQDFYLYFCDISYKSAKYPLFYIPFTAKKEDKKITINFDSQIYYNKKAIEYAVQEYNLENNNTTTLKVDIERILYLSDEDVLKNIQNTINNILDFFKLNGDISLEAPGYQVAKSSFCSVSNNCYISLFDKSDEALINDYEEILTKLSSNDDALGAGFIKLIDDFIYKDPQKRTFAIKEARNEQSLGKKLVYRSPIPLNEEQQQILEAVRSDECKYIIVQGPPGTGKSHTITGVVFDQILKDKSVLVLSDKKEALDVVEEKITESMDKVRVQDDFQNPILRLGRTGNTFSSILSPTHVSKISNAYFGAKAKEQEVEDEIVSTATKLDGLIEKEVQAYEAISFGEIKKFFALEDNVEKTAPFLCLQELYSNNNAIEDISALKELSDKLYTAFIATEDENYGKLFEDFKIDTSSILSLKDLNDLLHAFKKVQDKIKILEETYRSSVFEKLQKFTRINKDNFEVLKLLVMKYETEKQAVFGFFFKKNVLREIEFSLETDFGYTVSGYIKDEIESIKKIIKLLTEARSINEYFSQDFDGIQASFNLLKKSSSFDELINLLALTEDLKLLRSFSENYPITSNNLGLMTDDVEKLASNALASLNREDFSSLQEYLEIATKLANDFAQIPIFDYNRDKEKIEDISTMQMTQIMDKRFIEFYENKKNTALSLKKIIQKKTKFPKEDFIELKKAFPCILAGIRDYSEYIPLEPELFDLVIIDEASQVSIAQAFPALLRAKKVLVLGDKKQFSNVKTSQASIKQNREYLNRIRECFIENIGDNPSQLVRLEMFNIKSSILDFCEHICHYEAMLKKYFRGYKEIISYSNKYFYSDNLQVMKIRGQNIDDVLEFKFLKHDGRIEKKPNTNSVEIEYILQALEDIKASGVKQSVGIITPHTNQQKALVDAVNATAGRDYYINDLKLKIMTFDSCQGEERDVIFYSMVATENDDHLWGVFAKSLEDIDLEEDGKLKAQRLNVGFSRPKEKIVFVLSKPIEQFSGEIRTTLMHYRSEKEKAEKELTLQEAINGAPEKKTLLDIILETKFYKENKDHIVFKPEFDVGNYLKQLDENYVHPSYKVDCLFFYKNPETKKQTKIIIEYDGFKENLKELLKQESSHDIYLNWEDVYKQKVLEGYGYEYIRVNSFTLGKNPVEILNARIEALISEHNEIHEDETSVLTEIKGNVEGLGSGELKTCPECGIPRPIEDFKDERLKSGVGKICIHCKKGGRKRNKVENGNQNQASEGVVCPRCGSKMVYRVGPYGAFYGCSRFPYCRGIVQA